MLWDHRAVSTSGKYRELLVGYDIVDGYNHTKIEVINNHHNSIIHIQGAFYKNFNAVKMEYELKQKYHNRDEGYSEATDEDLRKFLSLIFIYGKVEENE